MDGDAIDESLLTLVGCFESRITGFAARHLGTLKNLWLLETTFFDARRPENLGERGESAD